MTTEHTISVEDVYAMLAQIPDPEIPVINVLELGVVREVIVNGDEVTIKITPTYSGCPAMHQIERDIRSALKHNGIANAKIETVYKPAWTTDWINAEAREKLRAYGIAPPEKGSHNKSLLLFGKAKTITCPKCGSTDTEMISQFGSTACKALHKCLNCKEPFDYFKCI